MFTTMKPIQRPHLKPTTQAADSAQSVPSAAPRSGSGGFGKPFRIRNLGVSTTGLAVVSLGFLIATQALSANPYSSIAVRNPFGLKPIPVKRVAPTPAPPAPKVPLAKVDVTGFLSLFGKPQVCLEITSAPGKEMIKPILSVGEKKDSVEVVAIDIDKALVTIKTGSVVTNITFREIKTPAAPTKGPARGARASARTRRPTGGTASTQGTQSSSGRGGVVVAGGNSVAPPPAAPSSAAARRAAATGTARRAGRTIPSRTRRGTVKPATPLVSRQEQQMLIELNREVNREAGRGGPPLPPTPLGRSLRTP